MDKYGYVIDVFKKIRKMRQLPAHDIGDDNFNLKLVEDQRLIVNDVFDAIRLLRYFLMYNSLCKMYDLPEWYKNIKIWNY